MDRDDDLLTLIDRCDVLIEFAHHAVTAELTELAAARGKALVIGTTGHTDAERAKIVAVTNRLPVVMAPNYSVGVNVLFYLTQLAAETLGDTFDEEVIEMHHHHKLDSPSGTARRLGGNPRAGRGVARTRNSCGTAALAMSARERKRKLACTRCAAATWSAITPSSSPPRASGSS